MSHEAKTNRPILRRGDREETTVGNYFVANYPPFSFWRPERTQDAHARLDSPPDPDVAMGLYAHIPFCRRRCDFCYFRVYTEQDSAQVRRYIDALIAEAALYARRPVAHQRRPRFVYFGGGTPSYLSADQLQHLFEGLRRHLPWDDAEEVTFECEPGTLQQKKIETLRALGVTRLSIGVENFDPDILERNNRAHRAKEIHRAYGFARDAGFAQINIDLIAGMIGETDENWHRCIEATIDLSPDSVTIYQMEVPYNTTISARMRDAHDDVAPVADWETKRRWVSEAFAALEAAGYEVGSAYTAQRPGARFVYRDNLWHGADMIGLGVASFSHVGGVHFQNAHDIGPYQERVEAGELPIHRAYAMDADEQLIRQFVLQLKLGRVSAAAFAARFGVDVRERFAAPLRQHEAAGVLAVQGDEIVLTRDGLLRVDTLLPAFFRAEHRDARYA